MARLHLKREQFEDESVPRTPDGLGGSIPTMREELASWLEMPASAGWLALFKVEIQDDRVVVAELRVMPSGPVPQGGLTAEQARVSFRAAISGLREVLSKEPDSAILRAWGFDEITRQVQRRPGPKDRGDRFYAEFAALYAEAVAGGSRSPIADLQETTAYSASQLGRFVAEARRRDLLTRSDRGRAAGRLTEKGSRALQRGRKRGAQSDER